MGARVPIVLTSRSEKEEGRVISLALGTPALSVIGGFGAALPVGFNVEIEVIAAR